MPSTARPDSADLVASARLRDLGLDLALGHALEHRDQAVERPGDAEGRD
jgi:hypothetical protein